MESFDTQPAAHGPTTLQVLEVESPSTELVRTLVDVDLATFSESTFSDFALAALLRNGRVFLLEANGKTIGTCVTMRCWERPNEVMVLSMGIKPGWRGQGLGQTFLVSVLDKLRHRGMRSACLYVGTDNRRAIQVYQDCGFESVEIGSDLHGTNLLLMRVALGEPDLIPLD